MNKATFDKIKELLAEPNPNKAAIGRETGVSVVQVRKLLPVVTTKILRGCEAASTEKEPSAPPSQRREIFRFASPLLSKTTNHPLLPLRSTICRSTRFRRRRASRSARRPPPPSSRRRTRPSCSSFGDDDHPLRLAPVEDLPAPPSFGDDEPPPLLLLLRWRATSRPPCAG